MVLPYTFATVHETQRLASVLSFIEHKATRDTSLGGYQIPKGTCLLGNLYGVMHDENVFEKPNEFIPERWIDSNGQYQPSVQALSLPFSAGPRACPGRQLASMVLIIFTTRLVANLSFEEIQGHENNMDVEFAATFSPGDITLKVNKVRVPLKDAKK